jgi:UDP-N-acetyl-D-glucosamine dehydrogenase
MDVLTMTASLSTSDLIAKILNRSAKIGVVGLGYVGLPLAVEKAKVGFSVLGVENNSVRANSVNAGDNFIGDVDDDELQELVSANKLYAEVNFDNIAECDVVVVCVPTPLTKNLAPNLDYVISVTKELAKHLRPGQLITLESTTYPGTTDDLMLPILEEVSGLKVGKDFWLAYSPERVDPGNARYTTKNTNKVVGASDNGSLEVATCFYEQTIDHVVPVSSASAAEMCKVFENTFRAVNIALVNELTMLCDRMDLNIWEVLDAANTKPFGIMPFYPGPGVGGHCIPLDPHYLEWKAKEHRFETHFISLAGEINRGMPEYVRDKAARILNGAQKPLSGSSILLLGVAYKKNIDDWRESPSIDVAELLLEAKAQVQFCDPHVSEATIDGATVNAVEFNAQNLADADLVIITTDHDAFDYEFAVNNCTSMFDTRGITRSLKCDTSKVVLL